MSNDRYTKIVLTVIAASLVWICARDIDFIESALAQSSREVINVQIVGIQDLPGLAWEALPVREQ
jgi:hypothetical protein